MVLYNYIIAGADLPVSLTPNLNTLVGLVDFKDRDASNMVQF